MPTLYKIRGFTQTDSAITLYTHKLWHRRHFLNREVPYRLQSSITGSPFRGLLLILQKNSMLTIRKYFEAGWVHLGALLHPTRLAFVTRCLLRSDWVISSSCSSQRLVNMRLFGDELIVERRCLRTSFNQLNAWSICVVLF